ncbi:MAG: hypothetical protein FWD14_03500 [Treponema sp.]|nr:hypothetical protein [Treponema sp.]
MIKNMIYTGKSGILYYLSDKPFSSGGEGFIHNVNGKPDIVAKIYRIEKLSYEKERKLLKMIDYKPEENMLTQIAWPIDVLYDSYNKFAGFTMRKMSINKDLNVIYEYGSDNYSKLLWENKIIIAENLCAVLHSIHDNGHHVCGDLNPKNISVNPETGFVVFLDTDSYHIQDGINTYRCEVGMPDYLPFEIQNKMRGDITLVTANLPTFTEETDNFALAIHIFQLLMNGAHPFACRVDYSQSHPSVAAPQPVDNIIKGKFPFMMFLTGIKIPVYAPEIKILTKKLQDLFKLAFIDGHKDPTKRPKPEEWHIALRELRQNLTKCSKVSHHQYYTSLSSCPWCEVDNKFKKPSKAAIKQTLIKAPSYTTTMKNKINLKKAAIVIIIASIIGYLISINNNDRQSADTRPRPHEGVSNPITAPANNNQTAPRPAPAPARPQPSPAPPPAAIPPPVGDW